MKTILKKLNLGAIAALVGIVGLTVSWKNHESTKLAPQWFQVDDTGTTPGNPDNQQISGALSGTPAAPCNLPSGRMCAIQIDLKDYDNVANPITTVAQADSLDNLGEIDLGPSVFKTP